VVEYDVVVVGRGATGTAGALAPAMTFGQVAGLDIANN
jgi:hypothetical protein